MRHALLVLILGTTSCSADSLAGSTWEEAEGHGSAVECPDMIRFEQKSYVYFNDCYALGQDGIVETGSYEFGGGKLRLYGRNISSAGSQLGSSVDPLEVIVTSTDDGRFVLSVEDTRIPFRRR